MTTKTAQKPLPTPDDIQHACQRFSDTWSHEERLLRLQWAEHRQQSLAAILFGDQETRQLAS